MEGGAEVEGVAGVVGRVHGASSPAHNYVRGHRRKEFCEVAHSTIYRTQFPLVASSADLQSSIRYASRNSERTRTG